MASKLLNVLTEIERGRQECISTLYEKGSNLVTNDSSFEDINEAIESLSVTDTPAFTTIPGEPNYETLTLANDPDIWRRPTNWPNIRGIYDDAEPIVRDGKTYDPIAIYLLTNEKPTVNFKIVANYSSPNYPYNRNDLQDNDFIVGVNGNITDNVPNNNYVRYIIQTSDESEYVFNPTSGEKWPDNTTYTHTWDATKDIVSEEERFRYVIVYAVKHTYSFYSTVDFTHYDCVIDAICSQIGYSVLYANVGFALEKFTWAYPAKATTKYSNRYYPYINYYNTNNPTYYRKSFIREYEDIESTSGVAVAFTNNTDVGAHVTNAIVPAYDYTSAIDGSVPNLLYIRCKTFGRFYNANGVHSYANTIGKIRYIEVVDTEYQAQHYSTVNGLAGLDNLIEENFTQFITNITPSNTNYMALQGAFCRRNVLSLPELTNMAAGNAARGTQAKHVYMPKLEAFPNFAESSFSELTIGVTSAITSDNMPVSIRKLHLPNLVNGTGPILPRQWGFHVLYLDVSNLQTTDNNTFGSYATSLQYIKLPANFKFNVNWSSLKWLNKQCIIDTFNRCATLEESEQYTISLSYSTKALLTAEEIAIATSKGWTVN